MSSRQSSPGHPNDPSLTFGLPTDLAYSGPLPGFDETRHASGGFKPNWQYLLNSLGKLGVDVISQRHRKIQRILRDDGATYNIYKDADFPSRAWGLDLIPSLVSSEDWGVIEAGLLERAELFDLILKDLYGERTLVRHGIVPPEVLFSFPGFIRACDGISLPGMHQLIFHASDLVRSPDGGVTVLNDRTQAPSGAGYALENRTVMSRALPSLFRDSHVHRLAHYFQTMRQTLMNLSMNDELPQVVVLSPGAHNETYFEHAYLANYLGFQLVQSADLTVRNGFVWMKSLDGLSRVDVILRRVDDAFCDPVELRADSQLGIPGLLEVVRAGRVALANPLGAGVLENPLLLHFLPEISKCLLGREPRMRSVRTYWCANKEDLSYVSANLDRMVIKPCQRSHVSTSVWGADLTAAQSKAWLKRLEEKPNHYLAQDAIDASHVPIFDRGKLVPRPVILRTFAVASGESYRLMPGGLTRVGSSVGARWISNQLGDHSKDTWVTASEPERPQETVLSKSQTERLDRHQSIGLPSRVAENLFWMGRYAERAEASLRYLRTVFMLLNDEDPISNEAKRHILSTVTQVTATLPGFINASDELLSNPNQELSRVINDASISGSVRSNLNAMLSSADESKELLSSDTLRVINDIRDALDDLDLSLGASLDLATEEALDPLVTALMALSGLVNESMNRGVGWHFMDMGRRVERSIQTISAMNALLVPVLNERDQEIMIMAMLRSLEVLITYRKRYRAQMDIKWGLELVYMDSSNPRSLLFQFERMQAHIDNLPKNKNTSAHLSTEHRYLLQAITDIKLSHLDDLTQIEEGRRLVLSKQLEHLKTLLTNMSNSIGDKYFENREVSHQLVLTQWDTES